jgi:hypothetical protein
MAWWASQIDPNAVIEAIVMENSAVAPEFQSLAARVIEPTLVVWTNCRPDHEEVWGRGREGAVAALIGGIPPGVPVACGDDVGASVKIALETRGNKTLSPLPLPPEYGELPRHLRENMELAAAVCHAIGLPLDRSFRAMAALPPDIADFRILERSHSKLAVAFSANEPTSTAQLFGDTGWSPEETTLLFHHRTDRPARLRAFTPWIDSLPWKRRIFTRDIRPHRFLADIFSFKTAAITWNDWDGWNDWNGWDEWDEWNGWIIDAASFQEFWEGQVFGCGNVAGWPLDFLLSLRHKEV